MERREAPGRCATAPLWGAGALRRTPRAPCKDRFARPIPRRARAVISGVRSPATEPLRLPALHPAGERPAEGSRAALSAARLPLSPRRVMTALGWRAEAHRTYHRLTLRSIRILSSTLMGTERAASRLSGKTGDAP